MSKVMADRYLTEPPVPTLTILQANQNVAIIEEAQVTRH